MYKSLQAGRAFAAVLVVLYHLGSAIASEKYFGINAFSVPFSFGASGVDFFFVLSGFIIFTAHRQHVFNPGKFANYIKKRLIRIYPTYWIVFLCVYFLAILSSALRNSVPHDAFVLLKSMLLVPQDQSVVGGSGAPVLIVAWTLQYEILFYLFFGLMILSRCLSMIVGLGVLGLWGFVALGLWEPSSFITVFLSKDYILLFIMGMIVSAACTSKIIVNKPMFYVGMGAAIFLLVALDTVLQIKVFLEPSILYGVASSLIIFGLVQLENMGCVIGGNRWIQILGDSSYALYLIHYPLVSILCKLSLFLGLSKIGVVGGLISYFSIFFACLIISVAFHLLIEKPVIAYLAKLHFKFESASI